jgi:hypothetical protein
VVVDGEAEEADTATVTSLESLAMPTAQATGRHKRATDFRS